MRKTAFIIVAITGSVLCSHAQRSSPGVKGSIHLYTITGDASDYIMPEKSGFHAGVFYKFFLNSSISLQPEVLYAIEKVSVRRNSSRESFDFEYLNVPLMLQFNASGFYLETGPQIGFLQSALGGYGTGPLAFRNSIKDKLNNMAFSWGAGAGYWLGHIGFGGRYNIGLTRLPKNADDGDDKLSGLQLSFLLRFRR